MRRWKTFIELDRKRAPVNRLSLEIHINLVVALFSIKWEVILHISNL
jgi:hypothetical protein